MKPSLILGAAVLACGLAAAAELPLTGLRGATPLDQEPKAPRIANVENMDLRRGRAFTTQPPTIPHSIERYEISRNVNFCMYCHSRTRTEESQAPMVSTTHHADREQDDLAEISPRRYFCTQCHVPQTDAKPPVANTFLDVEELLQQERAQSRSAAVGVREQRGE